MRKWAILGAVNGLIAVLAGAFATHGLKESVPAYELGIFEMAAQYQMYHALALFAVAWAASQTAGNVRVKMFADLAGWSFLVGIILFSGSLYHMGLTQSRALVIVTPLGGTAFLAGWIALLAAAWNIRGEPRP